MKLNKIMMPITLIFVTAIIGGIVIDVPYFINSNNLEHTISLRKTSNLVLKGEGEPNPEKYRNSFEKLQFGTGGSAVIVSGNFKSVAGFTPCYQ